jgi:hypothetical protein
MIYSLFVKRRFIRPSFGKVSSGVFMLRQTWPIALVLAASFLVGCDSRDATVVKPNPAPAPTTAPATIQPEQTTAAPTTAPATQPAVSELFIDGRMYKFPICKIRASKSGDHVIARLYTDDPKAALEDDYKGNRYDLQMHLDDITDPQQVYMSVWQFKAQSHEYVNSPYGIFLEGMRYQLQPLNATARFLGTMMMVHIDLEGQFLVFDDADKTGAPRTVYVKGSLLAPIEYKD